MNHRNRIVVVLSGGQDSTTCLFYAKNLVARASEAAGEQGTVHAVTFDYGQRHSRELESARKVAELAGVESHEVIELGPVLKGTSPLVSDALLEQYDDASALPGGIEKTFVPMRNQLFLTVAANRAAVLGCGVLMTGVSQEDYGGYPDCRDTFISALARACNLGTFTGEDGAPKALTILTPLMHLSKRQTVELALEIPGCYAALAWSHTSYAGEYPPTSKDHASQLRAKGFAEAGVPDPLVLRAFSDCKLPLPDAPNYSPAHVERFGRLLGWDF